MNTANLAGSCSTRVLDRIKHKHSFIIYHILERTLFAVKAAALKLLTFPVVGDISEATAVWVF